MADTITVTANWATGNLSNSIISRQYDNNRYRVEFTGYPEDGTENLIFYLLVFMRTEENPRGVILPPVQLSSDQWLISNYFTQLSQQIRFQLCVQNEAGTFEAHSPIFKGTIVDSLDHVGEEIDIDTSALFDAYREYINQLIIAAGAVVIDTALDATSENPVQNKAVAAEFTAVNGRLREQGVTVSAIEGKVPVIDTVSENYTVINPENWHNTATDTVGYKLKADGTAVESANIFYTDYISVVPGDVVRAYHKSTHSKINYSNLTYYDSAKNVLPSLGRDTASSVDITAPEGAAYIRISAEKNYQTYIIITINLVPTDWSIQYFAPHYVLTDDMLTQPTKNAIEALENTDLTSVTVKGYNLVPNAISDGTGAYYASGSNITFNESYTTYHYVILKVKPNTIYTLNRTCRWWILTSDSDAVITSGAADRRIFSTGNATKLYLTVANVSWNAGIVVVEGYHGCDSGLIRPSFVGGFNALGLENRYACALPRIRLRMSVGYPFTIYKDSALSLAGLRLAIGGSSQFARDNDDNLTIQAASADSSTNGYAYSVYDSNLATIDRLLATDANTKAKNLRDTTCLVIGDSTVAYNHMTQAMLDEFTAADKALTLLGTRGTAPNLHEGRAGATAKEYCTQATAASITNPFYNSETGHFDFSQYMTAQGYTAPDFVIIQLGINDLYNVGMADSDAKIEETAGYICEMIESIKVYDANIRILINLPTTPHSDQTRHSNVRFVYNNIRVRYCEYMIWKIIGYINSSYKVRETYNHLILDASTDISDNVHPTQAGFVKMGKQNVAQMNYWLNE